MKVTTFFKVYMFQMKLYPSSVQKPASGCEIFHTPYTTLLPPPGKCVVLFSQMAYVKHALAPRVTLDIKNHDQTVVKLYSNSTSLKLVVVYQEFVGFVLLCKRSLTYPFFGLCVSRSSSCTPRNTSSGTTNFAWTL